MYISRIVLNPERPATRRIVSQPRALHGMVQKSFPENTGRLLWKLDTSARDPQVYLLSQQKPSLEHVVERYGRPNDPNGIVTKEYSPVLNAVEVGGKFKFMVPANPTITIQKKRVPVVGIPKLEEWFNSRSEPHGFILRSGLTITDQKVHTIPKEERTITLNSANFSGVLEVTDTDKFRNLLVNGFGRGKAYGMGFLTIMRA